jgi:hypothetical protein
MTTTEYAARLNIDYPDHELDRLSTGLRILYIIPIGIVLGAMSESNGAWGGVLFIPALLMIVFRQKYPRWWFDFDLGVTRFATRVTSYLALMSDIYPSTDEEQHVHLELDYPDVRRDLNRWMPLVKWFLVIPHIIVLAFLTIGAVLAGFGAWFAILFTRPLPAGHLRLHRRRDALVASGRSVRIPADHRRVPALPSPLKQRDGRGGPGPAPAARPASDWSRARHLRETSPREWCSAGS